MNNIAYQTTLRGVEFGRYTSPYTLWMLQRVLDPYRARPAAESSPSHCASRIPIRR
mgnify:CR=1 FL=1